MLIAAGIAAYENPEVRAWFQERRRRIVLTLNEIAEEFDQHRPATRRTTRRAEDVSAREDTSEDAAERRRRARQEIMERGLLIDRKRREAHKRKTSESTFDGMVDGEGKLREKPDHAEATAVDPVANQALRNRPSNKNAITRGSVMANPFDDEMGGVINEKALMEDEQISHEPRATSVLEDSLQIVTAQAPAAVMPDGVEIPHLTPTTSVAASTLLSATGIMTPTSEDRSLLSDYDYTQPEPQPIPPPSYQSIQEWASEASSGPESFYSPPESERNYQNFQNFNSNVINRPSGASSKTVSIIGTNEGNSEGGDLGVEALSDSSGVDTPFTWSEVGSQVSADD